MKQGVFLWIVLGFFAHGLWAQSTEVKGKLVDEATGNAAAFVTVLLKNSSTGTNSDINGNFSLKVNASKQTLVFSSVEFQRLETSIDVSEGESLDLGTISLKAAAVNLSEMLVKSDGKYEKKLEEVTVTMDVLSPRLIENRNNTTINDALNQVPGVNIVDEEPQIRSGSGYSFGAGSRVMVLVDDMPVLSGDAGRTTWGFVPTETIEQVEVIRGPSSVLYGSSALNGVIHVRTTYPGSTPKTKIQTFTGFWDLPGDKNWSTNNPPFMSGISAMHMRQAGQWDLVFGMNAQIENGYAGPPGVSTAPGNDSIITQPSDTVKPGQYENRIRAHFNTRYRFKKVEGLTAGLNGNFLFSRSTTGFLYQNDSSGFFRYFDGTVTTTLQRQFAIDPYISYAGKQGAAHHLRTRVYSLNNENDNNQSNSNEVLFAEYQFQKRFLGEKAQQNKWLRDLNFTSGLMFNQVFARSQIFVGNAGNAGDNQQTNLAAYAQLEEKFFNQRLTAVAGLRFEYFKLGNLEATQPVFRGGLSYKLAEHTFLRASYGQGFRFPTIGERFIRTTVGAVQIFPNPNLRPETSWSAEIGAKQAFRLGKNFSGYADVALYYQEFSDFVEFTAGFYDSDLTKPLTEILGFMSINTGDARMYGVDFSLAATGKLSRDWTLSLLGGYNYSLPQTLNPNLTYATDSLGNDLKYQNTSSITEEDDTSATILKYRFRHTAKMDVELGWKMLSLGFSYRYNSFMENIDRAFYRLDELALNTNLESFRDRTRDGTHVVDMRVAVQITPSSRLSLIINNLFNNAYSLRPLFPEPPRSFIVQYALTL